VAKVTAIKVPHKVAVAVVALEAVVYLIQIQEMVV
jgi:hypothetical protein